MAEPTPLGKEFVEFIIFKREPADPLPRSSAVIPADATEMTEDMRKEFRKSREWKDWEAKEQAPVVQGPALPPGLSQMASS